MLELNYETRNGTNTIKAHVASGLLQELTRIDYIATVLDGNEDLLKTILWLCEDLKRVTSYSEVTKTVNYNYILQDGSLMIRISEQDHVITARTITSAFTIARVIKEGK